MLIAKQEVDFNFGSTLSKEWTWSWQTQILALAVSADLDKDHPTFRRLAPDSSDRK